MLTPAQIQKLRAIGSDPEIEFKTSMERLYHETERYLIELQRSVNEGKQVDEASNFCRWLQFSSISSILKFSSKLDIKALEQRIKDIIYDCGQYYKGGKILPKYAASDISDIMAKVDALTRAQRAGVIVNAVAVDDAPKRLPRAKKPVLALPAPKTDPANPPS
jgi:hypothetical protein